VQWFRGGLVFETLVLHSLRLKDRIGPVTRVKKKKTTSASGAPSRSGPLPRYKTSMSLTCEPLYHPTLGLRVIQKKKMVRSRPLTSSPCSLLLSSLEVSDTQSLCALNTRPSQNHNPLSASQQEHTLSVGIDNGLIPCVSRKVSPSATEGAF